VRADVLVSNRNSVYWRLLEGEATFGVSSKRTEHKELDYREFLMTKLSLWLPNTIAEPDTGKSIRMIYLMSQ
jgi:hypothetical protein